MNYATGQMASIVRLVSTDPYQPFDRVVRTVPVLQRAPWRPWPWRLWGGPSLAYGRSMADYPYMQPYADMRSYGWDMYATGQAAPADVRAAAGTAIRHSQPPPWAPTVAHQPAHNRAVGPIGGLGTSAAAGYAAAHQSDILAGTSIDPRLAAAVEQLGVVLQ